VNRSEAASQKRREVAAIVALIVTGTAVWLAMLLIVLRTVGLATFDHYGGAYGVSVGSNSAYCSVEWGHFPTCERAA